jgi:hypothetical protein
MTKDGVVLENVARPIRPTVPDAFGQLQCCVFKFPDWFETFMTSEDSTHSGIKSTKVRGGTWAWGWIKAFYRSAISTFDSPDQIRKKILTALGRRRFLALL